MKVVQDGGTVSQLELPLWAYWPAPVGRSNARWKTTFGELVGQLFLLILITTVVLAELAPANEWEQVFRAGMADNATGRPIRGTEIVHLVAHKGRLYAGNGYWMDTRGYANIPYAQVIALDSPDGDWRVDLTMGPGHLRVTALQSVAFATDALGKLLKKPVNLLLAASDIQAGKRESNIWTRDDDDDTWARTTLPADHELRRSTRAFAVHQDRKTGIDRLFVAAGALGIYSGVYDDTLPGKIRWDSQAELGPVTIRPMALLEANGDLYAFAAKTEPVHRGRMSTPTAHGNIGSWAESAD